MKLSPPFPGVKTPGYIQEGALWAYRLKPEDPAASAVKPAGRPFKCSPGIHARVALALACFLLALALPVSAQQVLLVHLPGAPVEAANRIAVAANTLADYLSQEVPELALEAQLFRRFADAEAFLQGAAGERVVAVLVEASFLLDAGAGTAFEATHRFRREGLGTYRRLVVVKADTADAERLVDLKGRSLSVVETTGASLEAFLERAVFEGEVAPAGWFGSIERVADDFSATAEVLYGQSDAALVGEHNPLLADHLGADLRSVYTSPPLSLPVVALRRGALGDAARAAWDAALGGIGGSAAGRPVLAELRFDGFEAIAGESVASLTTSRVAAKEPEIVLPGAGAFEPALPAPLDASQLPFDLEIELPDVPLPEAESSPGGV